MQIFVQLNTVGSNAGPFMVYSNLNNYQAPAYGPYTAAQLLAGVTITVPDSTTDVRIRSNGKCTNDIYVNIPTTTTTCAPKNFTMQASGITSITFTNFVSLTAIKIIWSTGVSETWDPGDPVPSHTYSSPYTGDIILQSCNLENITTLNIQNTNPTQGILPSTSTLTIKDTELTKLTGLQYCNLNSPRVIVSAAGGLTTSTSLLPNTLIQFWANQNNMTGDVVDLPTGLTLFYCAGTNTLNGVVANLPSGIQYLEVLGLNTIDGLIGDMPLSTISFVVFGNNTIHGPLSGIPGAPATPTQSNTNPNLQSINLLGNNYVRGDLSDMNWNKMTIFNLGGKQMQPTPETTSYLTGDLDSLPPIPLPNGNGVLPFRNDMRVLGHAYGYSTITGNVNKLPNVSTFYSLQLRGGDGPWTNTSYAGNIPLGYQPYPVGGWGITLTGDIADVPHIGMQTLTLAGRNAITGDIANFLPANACDTFQITGDNTIYGDISDLPPIVRFVDIQGANNVTTYSTPRTWAGGPTPPFGGTPGSMCRFILNSSVSGNRITDQTQINNLITNLSANPLWENYGSIAAEVLIRSSFNPSGAAATALINLDAETSPPNCPGGAGATVIP